jgi:two-component system, cell cycle response regulator DivK
MNARILLAEDNEQNRYLATYLLERAGHTVMHAANGKAAVQLAQSRPVDLVLMDIQMPEMDGCEATKLIHQTPGLENTPVVALTSFAMPGERERTMSFGFAGYIEKPISTEQFVSQIQEYLPEAGATNP